MLPAITQLFAEDGDLDTLPARVSAYYQTLCADENAFEQLPILDPTHPPESLQIGTVVRFPAMVQDTSVAPQLYLARQQNGSCGGWGFDDTSVQPSINDLRQCAVIWAVSIPGQSPWLYPLGDAVPASRTPYPHKYPLANRDHVGAQVKIYDRADSDSIKAVDIRYFVGILTYEPLAFEGGTLDAVPTIHTLFSRPVPATIRRYVYPAEFPAPVPKEDVRDELITWIADEALARDRDVAEWVLICVLSRVQSHNPPLFPVSLAISQFPNPSERSQIPALCHVLSAILPLSVTIQLSLDALNNTGFAPEFVDETLHSGWLQLPQGSVCILTEADITEGAINERGLSNLKAVQQVMSLQTLDYNFPYSTYNFQTDISFLVLTEGRKSTFFQTDFVVPLQPPGGSRVKAKLRRSLYKGKEEVRYPSQSQLERFRHLVGGAKSAKLSDIRVSEYVVYTRRIREIKENDTRKGKRGQ
ncbi:hypothetical protein AX16_004197 [Volvariella volvacea WC 439]|nr:hypothetical protein AX16_004197 [Volvariella volvacea WC 439]